MARTRGIARQHIRRAISHIDDAGTHLAAVYQLASEQNSELAPVMADLLTVAAALYRALIQLHEQM